MPIIEEIESRQRLAVLEGRAAELPVLIQQAARIGDVGEWMRLRMELDAIGLEIADARRALEDAQDAQVATRERAADADAEARIHNAELKVETCRKRADEFRAGMRRDESGFADSRQKTELAQLQRQHRDAVRDLRHARSAADRARGLKSGPPPAA